MAIEVVEKQNPAFEQEVRSFLATAPRGACGEHDPRWLCVLREGLGHRPFAIVSRSADGKIDGYLPAALVASRLFGRFLVSLPYLNRAGVVANDDRVAAELIERAVALADDNDVQYLELRHGDALTHNALGASRDEKVRMVLTLPDPNAPAPPAKGKAVEEAIPGAGQPGAEQLWRAIDSKARNLVRKGDKSELTLQWGGRDVLDDFYQVFAINMRDLGTPVYARKLFASILERLEGDAELAVVYHKGHAIAGALLVHSGGQGAGVQGPGPREEKPAADRSSRSQGPEPLALLPSTQVPSASALREFNTTNANMWMYHGLLLRAIARGSREFDFGRSSVDSGTYKFKKQWGAQPHPTVWQYHVRRGDINAVRPDNPKHKRRIETWQKLPVWLTRLVGPAIVRGIP